MPSSLRPRLGQDSNPHQAASESVVPAAITFAALGLDISQAEVMVCFLLPDGSEVVPRWTIPNSQPGAQSLAERVQTLAKAQGISQLRIGLEATGLYWWHLACFLNETPLLTEGDQRIYVFNPSLVQGLKRVYADAGKTDRLDAFFLAERLRVGRLPIPFQPDLVYAPEAPADTLPHASGSNARSRKELLPGFALLAFQRLQSRGPLRRLVRGRPVWGCWKPLPRRIWPKPRWKTWPPLSNSTGVDGLPIRTRLP